MGKTSRKRWDGNVRSMAIIAKDEVSTFDFTWQDEIVRKYDEGLTDDYFEMEAA